jgi:hypothetical protein
MRIHAEKEENKWHPCHFIGVRLGVRETMGTHPAKMKFSGWQFLFSHISLE